MSRLGQTTRCAISAGEVDAMERDELEQAQMWLTRAAEHLASGDADKAAVAAKWAAYSAIRMVEIIRDGHGCIAATTMKKLDAQCFAAVAA